MNLEYIDQTGVDETGSYHAHTQTQIYIIYTHVTITII